VQLQHNIIDNTLTWKGRIEMTVPKLSAVTADKLFISQDTMKVIYFSYFHLIRNYGLIFWGNSSYSNSIFR
jgi:hypothetical protein